MRHFSIAFSLALLLSVAGSTSAQEKSAPSPTGSPFLKVCNAKNPPPCADKPPVVTDQPAPEYSEEARKAKIEGTVVLGVVVGTDGRAHDIQVLTPLGYGLDERAIKALKGWRFKPARNNGKRVPVQIRIDMLFRIAPRL
jgi:TonB family protein